MDWPPKNVRELTVKQMLENREIDQIMKILALDCTKSYDSVKGLRYGYAGFNLSVGCFGPTLSKIAPNGQ